VNVDMLVTEPEFLYEHAQQRIAAYAISACKTNFGNARARGWQRTCTSERVKKQDAFA